MLQWKPQFYAVLTLVALVVVAFLGGIDVFGGQFGW
jgi:hypothetical protein